MVDEKNMEIYILEAAEKVFLDKGFTASTIHEIAKLAGCNQALVHYYYRTKEKLFEAIFEKKIRLILSNVLTTKREGYTFEEWLEEIIEAHFNFLSENPKLPFFIYNEIFSNPDRLHNSLKRMKEIPSNETLIQLNADLKTEIRRGNIFPVSFFDLFLTILSLNLVPFAMHPILNTIRHYTLEEYNRILERRKKENIRIILSSLRP